MLCDYRIERTHENKFFPTILNNNAETEHQNDLVDNKQIERHVVNTVRINLRHIDARIDFYCVTSLKSVFNAIISRRFAVYLKHVCIIYRTLPALPFLLPFIIIINSPHSLVLFLFFSLSLSLFLSRHTAGNFTERFNDTLIWYSFKRAPSNFTSSPAKHFARRRGCVFASLSIVISRGNICNLDRAAYIADGDNAASGASSPGVDEARRGTVRQMFRRGSACSLAGVAMLNNRVAGTFSRNEDVYQDPATGN